MLVWLVGFLPFSCVDEDNLGFSFVSSFGFGGRAEENVHSLYFKNTSTFKKTNTRSKGKGREKIIFKIIKHKNPGAYYIIKYVFKKKPTNYYTYVYESIKYSALVRNTHIPSLLSLTERDSGVRPAAGLLWPRVSPGAPSPFLAPPPPGTGARRGSPAPSPAEVNANEQTSLFPPSPLRAPFFEPDANLTLTSINQERAQQVGSFLPDPFPRNTTLPPPSGRFDAPGQVQPC